VAGGTEILELDTTSADFTVAVNTSAGLTADGACTFNDSGAAVDFRVEGVTATHLLFVDGSADKVHIGSGTTTPQYTAHISTTGSGGVFSSFTNDTTGHTATDGLQIGLDASENAHFFYNESGNMNFYTNGNNLAISIDSSQNVGIGMTDPGAPLDIGDDSQTGGSYGAAATSIYISPTNDASSVFGGIVWNPSTTSGTNESFGIYDVHTSSVDRLQITHDQTELIAITEGGNVGIGTTSPSQRFMVTEGVTAANDHIATIQHSHTSGNIYGQFIQFSGQAPDDNTSWFLRCDDNAAIRCRIYSDGDVNTSDAGTLTSDQTLKTNIKDATPKLADVMKLKVRNFEWIPEYHPNKVGEKKIGFIAQEFEQIFPGLVDEHDIAPMSAEEPNIKKAVRQGALIPILVKAIQELKAEVDQLKAS
jgi:hypothetical protein